VGLALKLTGATSYTDSRSFKRHRNRKVRKNKGEEEGNVVNNKKKVEEHGKREKDDVYGKVELYKKRNGRNISSPRRRE
jgi:hypothetical protein